MAYALAGLVTAAATTATTATTLLAYCVTTSIILGLGILVVSRVVGVAARYYTAVLVGGL